MNFYASWNTDWPILRDKYDYIGGDSCNVLEEKLAALVEFPPLNYCCYPAVSEQYIVPRENPWIPSEKAFKVMEEVTVESRGQIVWKMAWYLSEISI